MHEDPTIQLWQMTGLRELQNAQRQRLRSEREQIKKRMAEIERLLAQNGRVKRERKDGDERP